MRQLLKLQRLHGGFYRSLSTTMKVPSAADSSAGASRSGYSLGTVVAVGAAGALGGAVLTEQDGRWRRLALPGGEFRACCEAVTTETQKAIPDTLEGIVGKKYVTKNYRQKGSRIGQGTSLAYVQPGTLKEAVAVLKACVAADVAIIPQGANTSLTGGAIPRDECDRPVVVINMRRLNKILPIGQDANRVLCFSGSGIYDLKEMLAKDYKRDSHSVLGSIFLNVSVGAGVAYGSGGTQIRKGPAWTERALFCRVKDNGDVELVNTLGLKDEGDVLSFLDGRDALTGEDLDPSCKLASSWPDYAAKVRSIDGKVSRCNADTTGPDCCRSEGKVMILASIHDTYPQPEKSELVWVGCKDFETAQALKRAVALKSDKCMSSTCEYMNREVYDGVDRAGRILIWMIELVGMSRLEPLWNLKLLVEMVPLPFTGIICDKFLYWFNNLTPMPLPSSLQELGQSYDHHLLMEFGEFSEGEVDRLKSSLDSFAKAQPEGNVKYHVCQTAKERSRATLYRFVVAPAFRTFAVGKGIQGLSIDYALPKNFGKYPSLPEAKYPIMNRWVYSHLGCNVFHEDLTFGTDINVDEAKYAIKHSVEDTGGKLPAEHGHGIEYPAPKEMLQRWQKMDPLNVMNPGVGGLSVSRRYGA
mmetsp:Transcript_33437/g.73149  ORF Transcript_33437/g.73149 Transcript_33437/m.73149 type:complete len:641 (-) Transcript_33437:432-2354(-)